jgi:molybdenum cofactor cytidylyltransferase
MSQPTVIVLASGRGERFTASGGQGNKLHAMLAGQRVIDWTLDAVRASGLPFHVEGAGHAGMGDSIAAGVRATAQSPGWLILPADLPLISPQTIQAVAHALTQGVSEGLGAAYPVHQGERGHPVGFAASCAELLQNIEGNRGAAHILRGLPAIKIIVNDVGCITDIDTQQQLDHAQNIMNQRLPHR